MSIRGQKEKLIQRFSMEIVERWGDETEVLRPRLERLVEAILRVEDCVLRVDDEPSKQLKEKR